MVGIRLGTELESQLNDFSAVFKRPKSSLIREAIAEKLDDWQDMKMILDSYRDKGRRWTIEELMTRYGVRIDDLAN